MSLAKRLAKIWYGGASVPLWLRALVPVYRLLRAVHRAPYALGLRKPQRLPVPVIVVGNISVGGTGKTPLVVALVEALRARGCNPGVISRGYGGAANAPTLLTVSSKADDCGDEPVLIRRATEALVAIGKDRIAAGRLLLAAARTGKAVDIVIADDGLQHSPLFRNVEICVIDGVRRFGNGLLLPAGPLREPLTRLDSVTLRVCNGGIAKVDEVPMRLVGEIAFALADPRHQTPLANFAATRVHAVAGIGNPARYFDMLRGAGLDVIEHPFPDHHVFRATDFDFGEDLPVFMTEKDAVKCTTLARANFWQVPVRAELSQKFFDQVLAAARLS